MSRVDFYILPEKSSRERFACTITTKALQSGNNIYIHTASREAACSLDDLLWTFHDISFVPHTLSDQSGSTGAPVVIGWQDQVPDNCNVMINLTADIPTTAERFARIVEIVAGSEAEREVARNHYRAYRDGGHEMHDHAVKGEYD